MDIWAYMDFIMRPYLIYVFMRALILNLRQFDSDLYTSNAI